MTTHLQPINAYISSKTNEREREKICFRFSLLVFASIFGIRFVLISFRFFSVFSRIYIYLNTYNIYINITVFEQLDFPHSSYSFQAFLLLTHKQFNIIFRKSAMYYFISPQNTLTHSTHPHTLTLFEFVSTISIYMCKYFVFTSASISYFGRERERGRWALSLAH